MTDSDAVAPSAPPPATEAVPPTTIAEILLALQAVDTQADQLGHHRKNSDVLADFVDATATTRAWELERDAMRRRVDELGAAIEQAEHRGAELQTHRKRLEGQMKTVIAPREAEALMRELATIAEQVDELDLQELAALEEQSAVDDQLAAHLRTEEQQRNRLRLADDALAAEVADIERELARLAERRVELRSALADSLLATYDRKRQALGVAVAPLVGRQCQGCHLELSAAEIDTVKDEAAATGVTDCPDCGRLLIV